MVERAYIICFILMLIGSTVQAQSTQNSATLEGGNASTASAPITQKRSKDGVQKTYRKDGSLESEMNYKRGVPNGVGKNYFEDGKVQAEMLYKDGNLITSTNFYRSGQKMTEMTFKDGELVHVKQYDKDGKVIHDRDIQSGPVGEH